MFFRQIGPAQAAAVGTCHPAEHLTFRWLIRHPDRSLISSLFNTPEPGHGKKSIEFRALRGLFDFDHKLLYIY